MPDWGIWLIIALVLCVVEMATVGFLASLFALGAMVATIVALCTDNWTLEAIVFAGSSVVFTYFLRPYLVKLYGREREKTAVDRLVDQEGVVVQAIDNLQAQGQIKALGEIWSARSLAGQPIAAGRRVAIVRVEGVKAIVTELAE